MFTSIKVEIKPNIMSVTIARSLVKQESFLAAIVE
jgi:hypothetical protein